MAKLEGITIKLNFSVTHNSLNVRDAIVGRTNEEIKELLGFLYVNGYITSHFEYDLEIIEQ